MMVETSSAQVMDHLWEKVPLVLSVTPIKEEGLRPRNYISGLERG